MVRDEKQKEIEDLWWVDKCGTVEACTGFGKTRIAINLINRILPEVSSIIVIVPTVYLKDQWSNLIPNSDKIKVKVINTAVSEKEDCDFLILDEFHCYASSERRSIFDIGYKYILGLTATVARLDGEHEYLLEKVPVISTVSLRDAIRNKWIAQYKEYVIQIPVDLKEYNKLNKTFNSNFAYFNYDFNEAMSALGTKNHPHIKEAVRWRWAMQERKDFVYNHPYKIKVAKEIIAARSDSKIITFSQSIQMAESLDGKAYHSGLSKGKRKQIELDFISGVINQINTAKAMDLGADVPGVNLGICLSGSSSPTQYKQRLGRCIRKEEDKMSEFFTLCLLGTQEESWIRKATGGSGIIIPYNNLPEILLDVI